jgi:hypothetical protein
MIYFPTLSRWEGWSYIGKIAKYQSYELDEAENGRAVVL